MARSYARITTEIWRDPMFLGLTPLTQRAYLMLVTQPDITAAGVLTLTLRRWARTCAGDAELDACLDELCREGLIVIDEDAEELLIRSFLKWDGGTGHDKRAAAIRDAMRQVVSPVIAGVLAAESERLGFDPQSACDRPPDSRSDRPSDSRTDGLSSQRRVVVVTKGDIALQPTTRNKQPATRTPSLEREPTRPSDFDAFWAAYPRKVGKRAAAKAFHAAARRADPEAITRAAAAYAADPNLPEPEFVPHPSTWLSQDRWHDGPQPDRRRPTGSRDRPAADDRAEAAIRRAAAYRQTADHPPELDQGA